MKTTIFQPTTNVSAFKALHRVIRLHVSRGVGGDEIILSYSLTGSSADLNINTLLNCKDDIDIMFRTNRDVVIPAYCDLPDDNFMKSMRKSVTVFHMLPSYSYPGYIHLHEVGSLEWDETSSRHIFSPHDKGIVSDESEYRPTDITCA